jgi:hypothetical protein
MSGGKANICMQCNARSVFLSPLHPFSSFAEMRSSPSLAAVGLPTIGSANNSPLLERGSEVLAK